MLLKVLFWGVVAIDVIALAIFGLLGLAAAGPSRTHPIAALVIPFFLPALVLAGAVGVYLRASSQGWRLAALLVAALPILIIVISGGISSLTLVGYRDGAGGFSQFRAGPLRDIEAAMERNDAAAVALAAKSAELDTPGLSGATVLVLALRELYQHPDRIEVVRALVQAGADPNAGEDELPLQVAIGVSREAGPEPVMLLLAAGADPNRRTNEGQPAYFIAGGAAIDVGIMTAVLDRGADPRALGRDSTTALSLPVRTRNWPVVLLLLQRGAPWRETKASDGQSFRSLVEAEAAGGVDTVGLAEVIRFLDR